MSETTKTETGGPAGAPKTYGAIVWGQLRKRPTAMISLAVIVLLLLLSLLAPLIAGDIPIRWVENGRTSWPIFRYLTLGEYVAMAAFVLAATMPLTVRLLRRRRPDWGSHWGWAFLIHAGACALVLLILMVRGSEERRYGFYLERRDQAESAWFPLIAYPRNPGYAELAHKQQPPSWEHPLGTGRLGEDILTGMLYGARTAMSIGFVAVGISMSIGVMLGALSGYFGGWIDLLMMRIAEIFMCFPRFILIIILLTVIPPWVLAPLWMVVVVLGLTGWTGSYRMMRAQMLRIRTEDYMTAARALGLPTWRLLLRHAVPNGIAPLLVGATFGIAAAVFLEASLAFLNLVQTPSWGTLLSDGRQHLEHWWVWASAGAAIFVTVFVYNLLGEAIRDAIDPRLKI